MAFRGDQRGQVVHRHRDPLLAYAAPNADPVHGRLHLPSARHLLSQHLPTWDEWSSPGELIHPGDWPSISSNTSSAAKSCLQVGYLATASAWLAETWQPVCRGGARCESGSGQPLFGLSQRVAGPAPHPPLGYPERVGANDEGCRRVAMMIVSQCFWAETPRGVTRCRSRLSCGRWWPVTFPGRVPPLACCRRCLAGYGQSRRAPGLPFGSACAG